MDYWKMSVIAVAAGLSVQAFAAGTPVRLYRNPNCGCCQTYAEYLRGNGFSVDLIDTVNLTPIRQKYGIPEALEGCHTALIGNYVFEGLVPAEYINRVLDQHRPMKGLSVPGMQMGAPGMGGTKMGPINVYYLTDVSPPTVYATF
jgi:hypothetical protein